MMRCDLDGLMALCAKDAILENPLVWTVLKETGSGIVTVRGAAGDFFAVGFRTPENGLGCR